jgi:hypothetical protein
MRRKQLKFNPIVQSKRLASHPWALASPALCSSCELPVLDDQLNGAFLPGLVTGALCLDCLEMASHELLSRAARAK